MGIRLLRILPRPRGPSRPLAVLIGVLALVGTSSVSATADVDRQAGPEPTVVPLHGAFADASSWNGVVERLQDRGHTVVAPVNPLRGIAADSAYVRSLLTQIDGPVATGDKAAGSDVLRAMAQRAGADITELTGSHVVMVSRPGAVTNVIVEALDAVG